MVERNVDEGKLVASVSCVQDELQSKISIPEHLVEILGLKSGDKFNWYVKRKGNILSIRAVYIKDGKGRKYFPSKKVDKKLRDLE